MPSMQEVWDKFKKDDFIILAVSVDKEREKAVLPFMKEYNITFPVLYDEKGEIAKLYETTGVPETFILNRRGRMYYKGVGPQNWSEPDALDAFEFIINGAKEHPPVMGSPSE